MTHQTMREADLLRLILDWLAVQPDVFAWRNNTGAIVREYRGQKRFMRFGKVGAPDIIAVAGGMFYGIEVKGPKGEQSREQFYFQKMLESVGGRYILAHSLDDVVAALPVRQKRLELAIRKEKV